MSTAAPRVQDGSLALARSLAQRFVDDQRRRNRYVERIDLAPHGDTNLRVRIPHPEVAQTDILRAQGDRQRPAQVLAKELPLRRGRRRHNAYLSRTQVCESV